MSDQLHENTHQDSSGNDVSFDDLAKEQLKRNDLPAGGSPDKPEGRKPQTSEEFDVGNNSIPTIDNKLGEAFHYTDSKWKNAINENGLRTGSYATPVGNLWPTQASIELALPPNRNLPNAKLKIDLDEMRNDGYDIPKPRRVSNTVTGADGRVYTQPGGGYEMQFDYEIPPKYISIVEKVKNNVN